jgi:hypothetical protein
LSDRDIYEALERIYETLTDTRETEQRRIRQAIELTQKILDALDHSADQ